MPRVAQWRSFHWTLFLFPFLSVAAGDVYTIEMLLAEFLTIVIIFMVIMLFTMVVLMICICASIFRKSHILLQYCGPYCKLHIFTPTKLRKRLTLSLSLLDPIIAMTSSLLLTWSINWVWLSLGTVTWLNDPCPGMSAKFRVSWCVMVRVLAVGLMSRTWQKIRVL